MDDLRMLLTGDYWHQDFAKLIHGVQFSVMLTPIDRFVDNNQIAEDYSLLVVAQSRRGQFETDYIESIQSKFAHVPIVCLAGSWCEGETRSGSPVPGLIRVYWHQWFGRIKNFLAQLDQQNVATWNLPRICSLADRIQNDSSYFRANLSDELMIGISSLTADGHLMLQDACHGAGLSTVWIETLDEEAESKIDLSAICIEANSMNSHLERRVIEIGSRFPHVPIIATLNFPRRFDFESGRRSGISAVISKPFRITDLYFAIQRVVRTDAA